MNIVRNTITIHGGKEVYVVDDKIELTVFDK